MNFAKLSWNEKHDLLETLPKQKVIYLAADWARAILPTYEEQFPDDLRPRQAIEAVYNGLSPEDCRKAAHAAYWAANAAHAAAQAAYAAYSAANVSPDLVNEIYEASRIIIPKHLYTHDIKLMIQKAWDGENTIPYVADALEDQGFDTKDLRDKPFHGRSHGIFNHENT